MNKLIIIFCLVLLVFGIIEERRKPYPDYAEAHGGKAILYATAWCGYCRQARKLLNENNIPYFEYDIEKSQKGKKQHKELGGRGVPLLLINGEVLKGYNASKILNLANKT